MAEGVGVGVVEGTAVGEGVSCDKQPAKSRLKMIAKAMKTKEPVFEFMKRIKKKGYKTVALKKITRGSARFSRNRPSDCTTRLASLILE